jgi:hypothetical protein
MVYMYMKQIGIVIGLLLLISMVFATGMELSQDKPVPISTADNIKVYDKSTETVSVYTKDIFTPLVSIKLLTPKEQIIPTGYQKVVEFEIDAKEITDDFMKQLYFYNIRDAYKPINIQYDLRIATEYVVEEPIYETVCPEKDENKDGLTTCDIKQVGSNMVTKVRYDILNSKALTKGVQKISIWTDVKQGDYVEWIPEIYGTVIEEWGWWTTPTDANLIAYWKLDEASGLPQDSKGTYHGTGNRGITYDPTGKIGRDFNFAVDSFASFGTTADLAKQIFSSCAWVWTDVTAAQVMYTRRGGTKDSWALASDAGGLWYFVQRNTAGDLKYTNTAGAISANAWHFVCFSRDDKNTMYLWVDNVLAAPTVYTGYVYQGTDINTHLGSRSDLSEDFDGRLDEVSYWDKNLSASDVNALYNQGKGVTYCGPGYTNLFDETCTLVPGTTYTVTWNVYRAGSAVNLTGITADWNVNAYDVAGQNSPFVQSDINAGFYRVTFSRAGYDNNSVSIVVDGNETFTIYLTDTTAPTVGVTTFNGYTTYLGWINGSGNIIGGAATDAGSGINTATCQIQLSNGDGFVTAGTWDTDHCKYGVFGPLTNGVTYRFNTRVNDNQGNLGTGTATSSYIADAVGPTTSDNAVAAYTDNPTITITGNDGTGTGVKATWYCVDTLNTCTPDILGTTYTSAIPNGFIQTFYLRYVASDYFDQNGATGSTGLITVDRATGTVYPDNNSNNKNWLTITDLFAEGLFGFDYTTLGIMALFACAIMAFIFRVNGLIAIIMSIPLTYAFFVLAGGTAGILLTILVLEIIALAVKVAMSLMNVGNQGA